mgnify:CR=1 FL=1
MKQLLTSEELVKINVEGIKDPLYALAESLEISEELQNKISFIAPLDNLIWDRALIENCYTTVFLF